MGKWSYGGTSLVAPPTAPWAKNLGMIFKKAIANQYQMPSEVEKQKKICMTIFVDALRYMQFFVSFVFADFFFNTISCLNIKKTLFQTHNHGCRASRPFSLDSSRHFCSITPAFHGKKKILDLFPLNQTFHLFYHYNPMTSHV